MKQIGVAFSKHEFLRRRSILEGFKAGFILAAVNFDIVKVDIYIRRIGKMP